MRDLSNTAYFKLLSALLTGLGQEEDLKSIDKEEGLIEWEAGSLVVRLFPHTFEEEANEPSAIVLETDLMLLDVENKKANYNRFLILHQLNSVSRLTTGMIGFISESNMLSISKIVALASLDAESLANEIGQIIKASEDLSASWNQLAEVPQNEDEESSEKSTPSFHQMA